MKFKVGDWVKFKSNATMYDRPIVNRLPDKYQILKISLFSNIVHLSGKAGPHWYTNDIILANNSNLIKERLGIK